MHDGSVATLGDVLDQYSARGRMPRLKPVGMTGEEKRDLLAFFESLTDRKFLADARFSDPWN